MVALAVMAAGAHTMSIAAPALAEQERLAQEAEAASERAAMRNPAATDGLPVPALLGGVVIAFAVGLSAGHVHRRRRASRRSAAAAARPGPAATPTVPARTAPPEPLALSSPEPVVAPPPPPPPPPVRAHGPRILRFRAEPAPPPPPPEVEDEALVEDVEPWVEESVAHEPAQPEPGVEETEPEVEGAEPVAEPEAHEPVVEPAVEPAADEPRIEDSEPEPRTEPAAHEPEVEPAAHEPEAEPAADEPRTEDSEPEPRTDPAAHEPQVEPAAADESVGSPAAGQGADQAREPSPLGGAPENPVRDDPSAPEAGASPLGEAPEALRRPPRPDPEPEPAAVTARRFARSRAWPEDAKSLWTCEIAWKAGYVKSTFRAMAGPPGAGRRKSIGESPSLRWTLMTDPEPPTPEMIAGVKALVGALVAAGWERTGAGAAWYAQRFVWRGSGEPGPIVVPDELESAEPPPR